MTDRELRKLSRLELLELLLDVSKENRELEAKVKKLSSENEAAKSIENLSAATKQVSDILEYANKLTETLSTGSSGVSKEAPVQKATDTNKKHADRELYIKLMNFYIKNNDALEYLPAELKDDISNRIREIAEYKRNVNSIQQER